jgi:hypothetical protein
MGKGPWSAFPAPVQWQGGYQFCGWSMGMIPTKDGTGIIQMATSYIGNNTNDCLIGRENLLPPGTIFDLVNRNSGLCLALPPKNPVHGTPLTQEPKYSLLPSRTWSALDLGNETFLIQNPNSSLVLDDYGWNPYDGATVDAWDLNGFTVQQWQPVPTGDGYFKFRNVFSGKVIGVTGMSASPGAPVILWDDNGTPDHDWQPVPNSALGILP